MSVTDLITELTELQELAATVPTLEAEVIALQQQVAELQAQITNPPSGASWEPNYVTRVVVPTPDGGNQPTHPSVVDMGAQWNGYRYWLAFTPYTNANDDVENPCVVASNDLDTWTAPGSNPIAPFPGGAAYNSDTELVYDADNDRLVCFHAFYNGSSTKTIRAQISTDGVAWSPPVAVYSVPVSSANELSGSICRVGGVWFQWFVSNVGSPNPLRYRTSTDLLSGWSSPTTCVVNGGVATGRDFWHIGVFADSTGTLRMLMSDCTLNVNGSTDNRIHLGSSVDGIEWTIDPQPIMTPPASGWNSDRLYRASGFQDGTNAVVIYSAFGPTWEIAGMGRTTIPLERWP